jgi:hypothetical protein
VRTRATDPNETLVTTYQTTRCHNPRQPPFSYSVHLSTTLLTRVSPNPSATDERLRESQPLSLIEMNRPTYATPTPALLQLSSLILVLVTFAPSINPPKDRSQNLTCHPMSPNYCLQMSTQGTSKPKMGHKSVTNGPGIHQKHRERCPTNFIRPEKNGKKIGKTRRTEEGLGRLESRKFCSNARWPGCSQRIYRMGEKSPYNQTIRTSDSI